MTQDKNGRKDDVGIKLPGGTEIHIAGKSAIYIILALGALGLLYWHDYKSDKWASLFHEGQWAQMLILATPEKERRDVLKTISKEAIVPNAVQKKLNSEAATDR